jgi:Rho-binding antiterminator
MIKQLSCHAHDYFEIVCMRNSTIEITTQNKKTYRGVAIDIVKINQQEVLKLENKEGFKYITLFEIETLQATDNMIIPVIIRDACFRVL